MSVFGHAPRRHAWSIVGLFAGVVATVTTALVLMGRDRPLDSLPPGWKTIRPPQVVLALAEDGERVWAGGPDGVLALDRLHGQPLSSTIRDWPSLDYVFDLLVDRHGALWVAHRRGLSRYQGGVLRTFTEADGLLPGAAKALLEDRDGALWVGTETGLVRYDGVSWRRVTLNDGLGAVPVDVIFQDSDGTLWCGSASMNTGGVSRYSGTLWRTLSIRDGLAHNSVYGIIQDHHGALWFATGLGNKGGASRLLRGTWSVLRKQDGLAGEKVRSIYQDRQGHLWVGSESDGIAINVAGQWVVLTPRHGLAGWEVMEMLQDRDGTLWLATENGISRIASFDLALAAGRPTVPR